MIASSSTFPTHLGRVIWDLSRLLHVWEAAAYTWLAIILWWIANGVACSPPLNSGANAAPASVQALMLAMLESELQAIVFDIRSLMWDEWSYPQLL